MIANLVSQRFVDFSEAVSLAIKSFKSRFFDSAEVRFAQDDRPAVDMSVGDRTLEGWD
jgi:hypothetical protein